MTSTIAAIATKSEVGTEGRFARDLHEDLLARARALKPLLEKHAAENEASGKIVSEVIDAIEATGAFSMAVPRRWGGLGASSRTMALFCAEIGKGCPSSAWVVSILNSTAWIGSKTSEPMQRLMFGASIGRVCGPQVGGGKLVARDGRFFVSGKWTYASACYHADWALVPATGENGAIYLTLLRMSDVTIDHSWIVAGMRGTGSETLIAEEVEIGADQFCDKSVLGEITHGGSEPSDYWQSIPVLRAKALGVLVGTVQGLFDVVVAGKEKPYIYVTGYPRRCDSPVYQAAIGEIAAKIATARLLLEEATNLADSAAEDRRQLEMEERAMIGAKAGLVTELLSHCTDRLMDLAGSSGFADANAAQRFWRDYHMGSRHIIFNRDLAYEVLGQNLLGFVEMIVPPERV
ncbi:MAG: acyl-CoA dehydrogenase family protein [Candidatus Sphingomonas colombiensis]|nr:acyl-CoA dehydrogenase family protein [Sphingomonas sp.]WEK42227.1 MAG: acyl-CoA dehydrogenase family protein [Sphingomonas sp.]